MTDTRGADNRLSVLLIDSDQAWCELVYQQFETQTPTPVGESAPVTLTLHTAFSLQDAGHALETGVFDLVIANRELPDGSGLELLGGCGYARFPVVVISDTHGEDAAVAALKSGAFDYAVKSEAMLASLGQRVVDMLQEWELMLQHERTQLEVVKLPQREQQRLGRELHDGVGQQLTGLGLLARSLVKRLADAPERDREMAVQLASGLDAALADVRDLSRGLLPVQMDALGLVSALEELAARVSRQSGIDIELQHEDPILISDNEVATHVYRIIQEAINNAVKHAQAGKITLILEANDREAVIEVRDDGQGLPDEMHGRTGLGLHTMYHRCQLFGGSLDIYTHNEGGTRVRCSFPLHHADAADQ